MVVLIGLLVQGAVERYAVTRACNVAVRYGKRLPEMVLGEFKLIALHRMGGGGKGRRAGYHLIPVREAPPGDGPG